jgi:hypothetical protein
MILQLLEQGSLLRHLAAEDRKTPWQLFGSLKNIAERLRDCFRFVRLPDAAYDVAAAAGIQIRFDSS